MERLFGRGAPSAEYTHNPFPDLDRLRNEAPRYYAPDRDAWFFSNPNDIVSLLRDDRLSMGDRISFLDHSAMFRTNVVRPLRTWFLSSEPLLLKIVQEVVKDCLEKLATQKDADLVDAVARAIPSNVMAELLNIPRADLSPLLHLAEDVIRSYDINWSLETEQTNKIGFLTLYFQRHWRFASDAPLLKFLRDIQVEHSIPSDHMVDVCVKLFLAGTTTTSGCIANILGCLVAGPGYEGSIREPSVIDGLISSQAPILAVKRRVREAIEFGDITLAPEQKVFLLVASANRAPVSDGEKRPPNLTFGHGQYYCLGSALARLEISALLNSLEPIMPRFRLREAIKWREAWLLHEALSVRITLEEPKAC